REKADVNAIASRSSRTIAILVWNYHDDEVLSPGAEVDLKIDGVPVGEATLQHYRIDGSHSNAYDAWKHMGAPARPTPNQHAELEKAGQLQPLESPQAVHAAGGSVAVTFELPRQGVSLLKLSW